MVKIHHVNEMPAGFGYFEMMISQFARWRLTVHGLVERELSLSLAGQLDSNRMRINAMRWTFRASALAILAETVLWIAYFAETVP